VEGRALRTDSGGAGRFRGGLGLDTTVRNLAEGRWNMPGSLREQSPPWPLWGGRHGEIGGYLIREPGRNDFRPIEAQHHFVEVDTEVVTRTGGGGGFGPPQEREAEKVREDVIEGYVSLE